MSFAFDVWTLVILFLSILACTIISILVGKYAPKAKPWNRTAYIFPLFFALWLFMTGQFWYLREPPEAEADRELHPASIHDVERVEAPPSRVSEAGEEIQGTAIDALRAFRSGFNKNREDNDQ